MNCVKVTNQELFDQMVDDIDDSGLACSFSYNISGTLVLTIDGERKVITGDFGAADYEDEYGFRLECEDKD